MVLKTWSLIMSLGGFVMSKIADYTWAIEEYFRRLERSFGAPDGGVDEKGIIYLRRRDGETDDQFRERVKKSVEHQENT